MNNALRLFLSAKLRHIDALWIRRFTNFAVVLFFASLLLHSVDWPIINISRFEFKITMLPFILMLIALVANWYYAPQNLSKDEKIFYGLAFIYGISQFASIIHSPYPLKSFVQGIIVTILLIMMIIISRILQDKESLQYVYRTMGIVSLTWGLYILLVYQFITHASSRLGAPGTIFIQYWQGDPASFGDVLLFVTGSVYGIFFWLAEKKIGRFIIWILIPLWLHLFTLTYTKALILAGFFFFALGTIFLRGKKRFIMAMSGILFLLLNIFSGPILRYERLYTNGLNIASSFPAISELPTLPEYRHATPAISALPTPPKHPVTSSVSALPTPPKHPVTSSVSALPILPKPKEPEPAPVPPTPAEANAVREYSIKIFLLARLNPAGPIGAQSYYIRLKAMRVSMGRSFDHIFGNGAGLSQALLPKFADEFDAKLSPQERGKYENIDRWGTSIYGSKNNMSIIDAHNLFLTELFNVGIIGFLALVGLVLLVIKRQIRVLRGGLHRKNTIYVLFLSTFVSLLLYRMAGSYIVVPYFWVMLGALFGMSAKEEIV